MQKVLEDPCPDVEGMASLRKLRMLDLAVSFLSPDAGECYLEVGTYCGKSLIAAMLGDKNKRRMAICCDDFSEFNSGNDNYQTLIANLARYDLLEDVKVYSEDFRVLLKRWSEEGLPPVGVFFYDGAHDEASQNDAIRLVEPHLANEALVIVDDWRFAQDSQSYAEKGTKRAIAVSTNEWRIEWILPARFNGDKELWWNGVAVLSFRRA